MVATYPKPILFLVVGPPYYPPSTALVPARFFPSDGFFPPRVDPNKGRPRWERKADPAMPIPSPGPTGVMSLSAPPTWVAPLKWVRGASSSSPSAPSWCRARRVSYRPPPGSAGGRTAGYARRKMAIIFAGIILTLNSPRTGLIEEDLNSRREQIHSSLSLSLRGERC